MVHPPQTPKLKVDFNGLFGDILCISHEDYCIDKDGNKVPLRAGMLVTAFDEDTDDNVNPDNLLASGEVIPSPDRL